MWHERGGDREYLHRFLHDQTEGTGLGLSIVRRLVLDLEGTVRVASHPGTGTQVTVEIPAGPGGHRPGRSRRGSP